MKTNNKSRFKLTVSIKSDFPIDILYYYNTQPIRNIIQQLMLKSYFYNIIQ